MLIWSMAIYHLSCFLQLTKRDDLGSKGLKSSRSVKILAKSFGVNGLDSGRRLIRPWIVAHTINSFCEQSSRERSSFTSVSGSPSWLQRMCAVVQDDLLFLTTHNSSVMSFISDNKLSIDFFDRRWIEPANLKTRTLSTSQKCLSEVDNFNLESLKE